MTRRFLLLCALVMAACSTSAGYSDEVGAEVGGSAPDFTLKDLAGATHTLSSLKGKTVVLEWFNPECPYIVDSHSPGGALEGSAAKAASDGVVWLAINSGALGKQGHEVATNLKAVADWRLPHPVLRDVDGKVGKTYGATTTPHMFIIDAQGILQYAGAVDNQPMRQKAGDRLPYFDRALTDVLGGGPVRTPRTRPWGCSVKY